MSNLSYLSSFIAGDFYNLSPLTSLISLYSHFSHFTCPHPLISLACNIVHTNKIK
ncbi:hypothetical protein Hanom_Chr10g00877271 [Helianthus anomalus]